MYVVCPLVEGRAQEVGEGEEGEADIKNVEDEYDMLQVGGRDMMQGGAETCLGEVEWVMLQVGVTLGPGPGPGPGRAGRGGGQWHCGIQVECSPGRCSCCSCCCTPA